MMLSFMLLWEH